MEQSGVERKLTAILAADVKGYSRLMHEDEEATLETLTEDREVMDSLVELHHGRVVGSAGDSLLAEFTSVVDAVQCAVEIQRELKSRNAARPDERKMEFRIGVNLGDVIVKGDNIYGDGVNIAARLEALAEPGGICISGGVYEQLKNKLSLAYDFVGEKEVKNIAEPVSVFRVRLEPGVTGETHEKGVRLGQRQWVALAAALVLFAGVGVLAVWHFYLRSAQSPIEIASPAPPGTLAPQPLPDKPSIAVLPFANLSGDPEQEPLSDGLTEDIINDLSQFKDMIVIARNSVFTYKGKPVKVQQVSQELGVRYVLEGSVQKAGNRVRVSAQLVDATTGHHLWADRYDREINDVFALQDEITQKIAWTIAGYSTKSAEVAAARKLFEGTGTVVTVEPEKSRVVLDHEEIKDFMAPMVMSYVVSPATLLKGVQPGDQVRFTIDADKRAIVEIERLDSGGA